MYGPTTATSATVNNIFLLTVAISVVLLVLITVLMIFFAVKYRRSKHPVAEQIEGNKALEIIWTVVPTILVMVMFYYGFEGFKGMRDFPEDGMTVQVTGRMWDWSFKYENGKESNKLMVPVDEPVKLVMTSLDVNHSFFIPAFRVKEDLVPGRETYLWFRPQTTGPADIYCAEYCGERHSYMMSEVVVMEDGDFRAWYADTLGVEEERGVVGLMAEEGCLDCHSLDGSEDTGPTFKGLFGKKRVVLQDGVEKEVTADEEYLRLAIRKPDLEYVKGYEINMPEYDEMTDEQIKSIIEFLRDAK